MRANVKTVGLLASILGLLYSAQHMNLKGSLIHNFDAVIRDAARIPDFRHDHSHCAIVVSRLFGNHTERRRRLTLDWYRRVAIHSIRVAAEHSNMKAVMIVLHNTASYAHDVVNDTDTLGSIVSYFQLGGSVDMETTYLNEVQRLATERQCQVMSVMRLDADDMLFPAAFQNIEMGWKNVMASNKCHASFLDHDCPHALVSGVPFSEVIQYVLDPVVASDGAMTCSVLPPKGRPWQPGDELVAASQGMAVTMTKTLWMSQLDGDVRIVFGNHKHFASTAAEKMQSFNISPHFQILSKNHTGWIETPLSGHYKAQRRGRRNCTLPYLTQVIGKEIGDILWTNRRFIPQLTQDELESNHFFSALLSIQERKKFNAQTRRKELNAQRPA